MVDILLSRKQKSLLWSHLIRPRHNLEEAAFLFVKEEQTDLERRFVCLEMWLLQSADYSYQSDCHIELADGTRTKLIKRAHDLQAIVVEVHSHTGRSPARFSSSDLSGFEEWVPHVRWRLKGKPYAALVVTRSDFDGFVWFGDNKERVRSVIVKGGKTLYPNGHSPLWPAADLPAAEMNHAE